MMGILTSLQNSRLVHGILNHTTQSLSDGAGHSVADIRIMFCVCNDHHSQWVL